ncbi:Vta1 like-domain-containing protein [Rhodocollybia butyracea]|uniref:Vta1 like-domain-containing protein n=1 Tax=Rhodocollybia butyracea TaxID=206335 RepID=A0A9P5Q731_9AGAR|nr:Vta1 like-domain-containing protein [Rhodocollybia butyracea]
MASFGLSSVPPALKAITPYLQRADELHQKDPVIAYWSAYYAAQVGISLKAKDNASRTLLLNLLDVLEKLKNEIGPSDAIDIESASAAYVENFALKVFGMADDEDRRGDSTRSTAKKFLAAANFLEVLKTFPQTELTESTEEKIRYAKWKAADIAKAFREGRKPTPGAVGEQEVSFPAVPPTSSIDIPATTPTNSHPSSSSPQRTPPSPPAIKRSSPPPVFDKALPPHTPPSALLGINPDTFDPISPGRWSTAATPGAGTVQGTPTDDSLPAVFERSPWPPESPMTGTGSQKPRRGSQSSTDSAGSHQSSGSRKRKTSLSPKKVHFSADATLLPPPANEAPHFPPESNLPPFVPPPMQHPQPPNDYSHAHVVQPPQVSYTAPPPPPPAIARPAVELSPAVIAKAQKHCRFAISALDYEDAEHARKELRAALAVLGG